jgi:D-2-hydroxyacid dehydrogenase (NADP+)
MPTTILFAHRDVEYYAPRVRERFPEVTLHTALDLPSAEGEIADADAIISVDTGFSAERLAKAKRLKWIQTLTTGTNVILGSPTLRPETVVTTTRGIHGPQMSEMAFTHMLNLARGTPRMWENQKKHVWKRWTQTRLFGKTAVVVGVGLIAEAFALRCKAFGMTVVGITRTPRGLPGFDRMLTYDDLERAARLADFLVLLAPYSPQTDGIVNVKVLAAMKPTAFLVNISRGGLCDEDALLDALRAKRIAGAGLDVFRQEPLPSENPFWDLDNVLISSHCAGSSDDNTAMIWGGILEKNISCFLDGRYSEMINLVPH